MASRKLVIATRNKGKMEEFRAMLADLPVRLLSLADFPKVEVPPEDGDTYAANALIKARSVARATGLLTLADDSGLEVDALGGQPGVHSAYFAGEGAGDEANNQKLLGLLKDVAWKDRTARFRCVLALVKPVNPAAEGPPAFEEFLVEATCEGMIGYAPRGDNGFGYDPLFYLPEFGCTVAELPPEVKNRVSHRGRALAKLRPLLEQVVLRSPD